MKYFFIAINYNNAHHTLKYIESIKNLKLPKNSFIEIIIIDNNSSESLDSIKELISEGKKQGSYNVLLIENSLNLGYFKGLNIGLKTIDNIEQHTVIVGNNDLLFNNDFLIKLEEVKLKEEDYCIAPNVILSNGTQQNPHALTKPSYFAISLLKLYYSNYYLGLLMIKVNQWIKRGKKQKIFNEPIYIHGGIGAIYILTPKFFIKNKLLNAPVFLYGEEVIFSNQVHSTNGKILYCPDIKVIHNEHSTVKKLGNRKLHKIGKESFTIFKQYY